MSHMEMSEAPRNKLRNFVKWLKCPYFPQSDSSASGLIHQKEPFYMAPQARVKHFVPVLLPTEPTRPSSELSAANSYKSMWGKVPAWFENCLKWHGQRRLALFSSMKSMLSVVLVSMTALVGITRFSELCLSLSHNLTGLM